MKIQICEIWDSEDNVRKRPFYHKDWPSHPFEANWVKCKDKKNIWTLQIFYDENLKKYFSQGLRKGKMQ